MGTTRLLSYSPSPARILLASAALVAPWIQSLPAQIDQAVTQRIWQNHYGVTDAQLYQDADPANGTNSIWLAQDADLDGLTNGAEIASGTNPFDSTSLIAVSNMTLDQNSVAIEFPTEAGKLYRLESSASLTTPNWTIHSQSSPAQVIGDGSSKVIAVPSGGNTFYRVRVEDADQDSDRLSDWAELAISLSPLTAQTTPGVNDYSYVTEQLTIPNVVSIEAVQSFAAEDGPVPGAFTVSRTRRLFADEVSLELSGTAQMNVDYAAIPTPIILSAGTESESVAVNPTSVGGVEGSESVTATILPSTEPVPAFSVGAKDSATVIIEDSTVPVGTGLLARYYDHANTNYVDAANFGSTGTYVFTRGTPTTTGSIVVTAPANQFTGLQQGHQVKLTFTSGNAAIDNATFDHQNYVVTAVSATAFTVAVSSTTAFSIASTNGNCAFSIQSFPHPPVIERVEILNHDWGFGTPNNATIVAAAGTTVTNVPDNYSNTFETFLSPTTAGSYRFQLDADDRARVLLDLNDGNGLQEILEHGWDGATTPETIGTFKISSAFALAVPATPANRYRMRIEHVETTGAARCRLQWSRDGGNFSNIPQGDQFTHTQAFTSNYSYTRTNATTGTATITVTGHGLNAGDQVALAFSSGNLFTPNTSDLNGYSGTYTVLASPAPTANTFTVAITGSGSGSGLPSNGTGTGFLENRPSSTTTGVYNKVYTTTNFTRTPARIGIESAVTSQSNGIWGAGSPDGSLINPETFTARWTGQVQPQFTEEYTLVLHADDSAILRINGQVQELKTNVSTDSGNANYTYDAATGNTTVTYPNMVVKAGSFVVGETVRLNPTSGNLSYSSGSTYSYDSSNGEMVITYSGMTTITPGSFLSGQTVFLDPTNGNLSSLASLPYTITAATSSTFTVNAGAGLFATGTGNIDISDTMDLVITQATSTSFTVNHGAGKHANASTGNTNIEIVNKPLKDWSSMGNERYVRVPFVGGTRYDIEVEYYENGGYARCFLYWQSPSQPRQFIPAERLYPSTGTVQAPPALVSNTEATALVGGPFSYAVLGSNGGTINLSGLPPGLTYSNGVISGSATTPGNYQILITMTNAVGTSTSLLNLRVEDTGGSATRELWTGITGTAISSILVSTTPNNSGTVSSLAAPSNAADNFGARIRGYITAPTTGNYYFWLSASESAEFWLSNDAELVNVFKRASITGGGDTPQQWSSAAKSPWMALEQGKRYYFEILHKSSTGVDHLALGWSKPGESTTSPTEVVPGYVLSPYEAPSAGSYGGTLYVATLLRQNGAIDPPGSTLRGIGTATLRISEDESTAEVRVTYSGLSGGALMDGPVAGQAVAADGTASPNGVIDPTDWHVHSDPFLGNESYIIYDGAEPLTGDGPQFAPDGSFLYHKWNLAPAGTLGVNDIRELIKQGKAYINLHTALNPAGEIRGNFTLANGSRTFSPPPPPPTWTDDSHTDAGAARFLSQASFGASPADITALKNLTPSGEKSRYELWIEDQFSKPASQSLPEVLRTRRADAQGGSQLDETLFFNSWWRNSISGQDQLRQRIAFALSQIHVISGQGPLDNRGEAIAFFYDKLAEGSFGNFREILEATTLTPAMGRYLDMRNNDKPDLASGRIPNENYAREIKQLFSVGLYRVWPDGTLMLNSNDQPIDTYTQREIVGYSHVFTGWTDGYDGAYRTGLNAPANWLRLMREVPARHFTGQKRILNNEVLPGLSVVGGQPLDPFAVHNSTHWNQPAYQQLAAQELELSHDQLFAHPNTGPFICRQLIQRMVTSHPSRDYLYRVVKEFNDNGSGVRGDMQAVIKAILLDYEARSTNMIANPSFGKQREPLLRVAMAGRAFRPKTYGGTYTQSGTRLITIDTTPAGTPHGLANGNNVLLEFVSGDGAMAPWTGPYSVVSAVDADTFTVNATGWATGTYTIPANSTTCTISMTNHWLQVGNQFFMDFTSGAADGTSIDNQVYTVLTNPNPANNGDNGSSFTFNVVGTSASVRSGNCMLPRFNPGSMTIASSGLPAPNDRRVTMRTEQDHHLAVGNQVQLNVYATQATPQPIDLVATVDTVVDLKTWTFLVSSATTGWSNTQGNNSVYQFPLVPQPLARSGTINSRSSTYQVGSTDGDLDQSPLNADTVFNFFLPDYKFPGQLASAGVTTPEFQITAETGVIRQTNYLYNGVFNPNTTNGYSSFNGGNNAVALDYSQWIIGNATTNLGLGAAVNVNLPWTHNENLSRLIDHLSVLLTADQLPAGAKTIIRDLVSLPISSISTGNPCRVTTIRPHGYSTGQSVCISGVTTGTFSPTVNDTSSTRTITVTGPDTFTVTGVNCTAAPNSTGLANAHVSQIIYNQGSSNPTATQRRDRFRAILHLILTSPDFIIQR